MRPRRRCRPRRLQLRPYRCRRRRAPRQVLRRTALPPHHRQRPGLPRRPVPPGRQPSRDRRLGGRDIVLRCGVTPPGVTADPCFAVDGVDWVMDLAQSTDTRKVIVTYGRDPATQVVFDGSSQTDAALIDLSRTVALVKQTSHCIKRD
ncbi:DUF3515 family protein [Streptomyces sp. NPDC002092]